MDFSMLAVGVVSLLATTQVAPVRGECDPSHAVVAVASVLSTLGFVAIVLAAAYLIVKRRRAANTIDFGEKRLQEGHVNSAFANEEIHLAEEGGVTKANMTIRAPVPKISNDKTWASLPRPGHTGRLYKEGSYGSLNGNYSSTDPEVVSVTLESQDIIGLGFNICGSYGDGIQVSEVNNRGPAKESGEIKVGDRILSVTVSYEHIVYEDALTILSYASPYPVKILLQKATEDSVKTFEGKKIKVDSRRLSHPLFRSRSMEAIKAPDQKDPASRNSHPKRTQSDLKSGNKLLKWPGKHSRKSQNSPVRDGGLSSKPNSPERNQVSVDIENFIPNGDKSQRGIRLSSIQDAQTLENEEGFSFEQVKEPELNADPNGITEHEPSADSWSPKLKPDKPERKNRRKSDVPNIPFEIGFDEVIVATKTDDVFRMPNSINSNEPEVEEDLIVPEISNRGDSGDDTDGSTQNNDRRVKDIKSALSLLSQIKLAELDGPLRSPSPDGDPVDEEIIVPASKSANPLLSSSPPPSSPGEQDIQDTSNNNSVKKPTLNDEILDMIIAMNAFPPGTQGWAGLHAGGSQGGVVDDFVPNDHGFVSQPVPKAVVEKLSSNPFVNPTNPFHRPTDNSSPVHLELSSSPSTNSNRSVAYEIRDDVVTGVPFSVEINKHKHRSGDGLSRTASADSIAKSDNLMTKAAHLHTSKSFDNSRVFQADDAAWSLNQPADLSDSTDSLDWSGKRLVRSESFSNIFVNE
ncbi:unnamed protein product [Lymnaea stagnalis]|uniref:PDZ domain-containing protein n=1 Tax=Lymnaea stagnalis TaxID=6523 RepID=A0AAV2HIM6_LYMST